MADNTRSGQEEAILVLQTIETFMDKLGTSLQAFQVQTAPEKIKELEPLERSKTYLVLAYATGALLYMYLRIQGIGATEHSVQEELRRIKERFQRLNNLQNTEKKRSLTVDEDAAGRILAASLVDLPKEEKYKLRKSKKRRFST
eukprot:jgi/Galph1/1253/GphlegSOOS_G5950.1